MEENNPNIVSIVNNIFSQNNLSLIDKTPKQINDEKNIFISNLSEIVEQSYDSFRKFLPLDSPDINFNDFSSNLFSQLAETTSSGNVSFFDSNGNIDLTHIKVATAIISKEVGFELYVQENSIQQDIDSNTVFNASMHGLTFEKILDMNTTERSIFFNSKLEEYFPNMEQKEIGTLIFDFEEYLEQSQQLYERGSLYPDESYQESLYAIIGDNLYDELDFEATGVLIAGLADNDKTQAEVGLEDKQNISNAENLNKEFEKSAKSLTKNYTNNTISIDTLLNEVLEVGRNQKKSAEALLKLAVAHLAKTEGFEDLSGIETFEELETKLSEYDKNFGVTSKKFQKLYDIYVRVGEANQPEDDTMLHDMTIDIALASQIQDVEIDPLVESQNVEMNTSAIEENKKRSENRQCRKSNTKCKKSNRVSTRRYGYI